MTVYTYWANKNEHTDGTAILILQSGPLIIGHSADFTPSEYTYYSKSHILFPGAVTWTRTDFTWTIPGADAARVFSGGGGGSSGGGSGGGPVYTYKNRVNTVSALPATGNTVNDVWLVLDTDTLYVWGGSSWGVLTAFPPLSSSSIFTLASTDGNGVKTYNVNSTNNGPNPQHLRVLEPTSPAAGVPHNFIYLLSVEGDVGGTTYGNGMDTLRALNAHNQYNLTIFEIGVAGSGWIADNPSNPARQYETYIVSELVPWVTSTFATGSEKHSLIGFSRGGIAGQDLILKHPTVFDKVASWDFPSSSMVNYTDFGADNYGNQINYASNYQLTSAFVSARKAPFQTSNRIWIGGYQAFQADVENYDSLLTAQTMAHTLGTMASILHRWDSGWVPEALSSLFGAGLPTITDDFNRADGGLGANWTLSGLGAGGLVIASNQVKGGSAGSGTPSGSVRSSPTFNNDQTSQIAIQASPASGHWIGPAVRSNSGGTTFYLVIYFNTGTATILRLYKCVTGTFTQLGADYASGVLAAGTVVKLSAIGTTIVASIGGTDVITVTDSSIAIGSPGVFAAGNSAIVDNWGATGNTSGGSVDPSDTPGTTFTDNFNRADGDPGTNWSQWDAGNPMVIVGNQVVSANNSSDSGVRRIASGESYGNDMWSQIEAVSAFAGNTIGASVRAQASGDLYLAMWWNQSGAYKIAMFKDVGGVFTQLGSLFSTIQPSAGDTLRLTVMGTLLRAHLNGTQVIRVFDSDIASGGAPGILGNGPTAADNWSGGPL